MTKTWEHGKRQFQYVSFYCLPEDAWFHEVSESSGTAYACLVVPDMTPDDGPFTAGPPANATLRFSEGEIPWPIWLRFMVAIEASGHIVEP